MSTLREQIKVQADQIGCTIEDCVNNSYLLSYLKEYAQKIGMDSASVSFYGTKSKKINWFLAIDNFEKNYHTDNSVAEDNPFSDNDDWLEGGLEDTVISDNLTTKKCVNHNPDCDCVEPCFGCHKIYDNDEINDDETCLGDCNPVVSNSFDSGTLNDDLTDVLDDTHTIIDGEYVMKSEICNPATLQSLRITDQNFKSWEPWMLPGAKFCAHNQECQILYVDLYGNVHAKGLTDNRWHSFRLETIVNCQIHDWRVVFNQNLKPTLSMLYKPTVVLRRAKLKKENNAEFRDMYVLYDRSFIIHRLANILSDFGRDDKHLLKGLFDDVLQQILTNEHNNELLEAYGMNINDDE